MEISSRTVISHFGFLAVGLCLGLYLARITTPEVTVVNEHTHSTDEFAPAVAATAIGGSSAPSTAAPAAGLDSKLINLRQSFDEQLNKSEMRQALLILQEMEKAAPNSKIYFETNGEYLMANRDWDTLKASSKKCIAAFPQSRVCLRHLANAELQIGSKEDQLATVNACLAIEPNDPECRNLSGMALMNSGDFSGAVAVYEKLIRDNGSYGLRFPEDMLEYQLGLALDSAGRREEAIDHMENACRRNNQRACDQIEELSGGGYN